MNRPDGRLNRKAAGMDEIDKLLEKKNEQLDLANREAEIIRAEIKALREAREAINAAKSVTEAYAEIHSKQLRRRA